MFYKSIIFCAFNFILCQSFVFYDIDIKGESINGYFISTFIGTPPQEINLLVDTGSSNLAIASVPFQKGIPKYFAYNESLTFVPSNTSVQIRYVQGDWTGFIASDVFNPCFEKQNCSIICDISCMTSMNNIFDDETEFQGILGLAYSSIAKPDPSIRPFFNIFTHVKNTSNVFALHLCGPYLSSKTPSTTCGKFHIGFSDEYDFRYTPIRQEWFYEITVTDIKVGQNSVPVKCSKINQNRSIVDSGTSDFNVPLEIYSWVITEIKEHVHSQLPNQLWINETVYCTESLMPAAFFPNLTLNLYHTTYSSFSMHVSPELYLLPVSNTTGSCVKLGIGVSDQGVVIGSTILKGFYVVFDRENKKIGFAKPKNLLTSGFISDVSNILFDGNVNFDQCMRQNEIPTANDISPLVIIALICISLLAILLLYALLSWIWRFHILGKDNLSDTSSLVDSDQDE